MKRFDNTLLKIFLYGIPLFAAFAAFAYGYSKGIVSHTGYFNFLNQCAGLIIASWMTLALYLSLRLFISGAFRDHVITRLTFMRERDEREAALTGRATKTTFLTTLALLILLFCLSCFQISVYRVPQAMAVEGKTGRVQLGLGFSLLEREKQNLVQEPKGRTDIFSYQGLPVSSEAVILLLIVWQIAAYNWSFRRLIK